MSQKHTKFLLQSLLFVALTGCASIAPPPGGPEDKIPPEVMEVIPPTGSTGINPNAPIEIVFSEPVDPIALKEALFISPPQIKDPVVKVHGKTATIRLRDQLPADQTVVITIGTRVVDLRNNPLAYSYTLAITGSEKIDKGRITGTVFSAEKTQGMMVGAWKIVDNLILKPDSTLPPVLTQTGDGGRFYLDYLSEGMYRIACWDDKNRDRFYAPGIDRLGLPWHDVALFQDATANIDLYPIVRDTSTFRAILANAPDNRHIVVRFSRNPSELSDSLLNIISVKDSLGSVDLESMWWNPTDSARLVILTPEQSPGRPYSVYFEGDTVSLPIKGAVNPDTLGPRVVWSFPSSRSDYVSNPVSGTIFFDDKLENPFPTEMCSLWVNDSINIPLFVEPVGNTGITWKCNETLALGAGCLLTLYMPGIRDYLGNSSPDTAWSVTFKIADPAEMGSISGKISGEIVRPVYVSARDITSVRPKDIFVPVDQDGNFRIPRLNEAQFLIWGFSDIDENKAYSPGKLNPFNPSERFFVFEDTVQVRARWETGGVDLELP